MISQAYHSVATIGLGRKNDRSGLSCCECPFKIHLRLYNNYQMRSHDTSNIPLSIGFGRKKDRSVRVVNILLKSEPHIRLSEWWLF